MLRPATAQSAAGLAELARSGVLQALNGVWTRDPFLITTVHSQSNSTTLPVGSCTPTIPCSNGACCNGDSGFCGFAALDANPIAALLGLRPAGQISKARSTGESATTRCEHKRLIGLNFAFALISNSFTIIEMSPGDAALWARTTALKKNNVALKVFLSIGGWSFNDPPTSNIFSQLVGSDANTATFIASTLNTLQAYGFDGIDVDWEYPAAFDRGGAPADKANYVTFMSKVKAAFKPRNYGLTFTAPSSYWYLQHFDLPGLMQYADWVNIMSYDLHGTWDGTDPYIGSIVLAHTNLTEIEDTLSLFNNVGVNPSQIVLGIGFYGRSFQLADPGCSSPGCVFVGGAAPGACSANSGTLMFSEIETIITQNGLNPVFDEAAAVKYIVWNNDQWVSYDDAQTLQMKVQFANSRCLGGTLPFYCHWVGDLPNCLNAACPAGQVGIFSDIQGDASQSCVGDGRRLYCCNPPNNEQFLPVPEQWVLPSLDPTPGGHGVIQPATFTVDFDDNIGTSDPSQTGAGSSGESDDGKENDSPFGEVFISSPNPGSVSSLDLASDWVIHGCDRSSDQAQEVLAYCSKALDGDDSGCGHVFIGQAEHTVVRLPKTCGLGPYARIVSLAPHEDQTVLPSHLRRALPDNELVYSLKFDYNFAAIPDANGPILMRADVTDMPGYWNEMINTPPDDGTVSTKRSNRKRDYHQPEDLERRWFGPFSRWVEKLNTVKNGNSISRNFHWSDTSCPNFSSSLDISVTGTAQANSRFGYYLEATIIPPAIQQCYVYLSAGASAQATFTITGLAEAHFGTERAEIISFGFPGVSDNLIALHLYGELTGQLSMSGSYSASVGYEFPSIDLTFGKEDKNADVEDTSNPVDPNANNNGFDYSFGYNVNLEGNVPSLQLGVSVLGGAVLDAQVFTEADIYAGVGITGSVSSAVSPNFCVNPVGLTGSVLFWRDNAVSYNFYSKQFPFGGGVCLSLPSICIRGSNTTGSPLTIHHRSPYPAYAAYEEPTQGWIEPPALPVRVENPEPSKISKRGVPFLPGNLFCPEVGTDIVSSDDASDCICYSDAEDNDPEGASISSRSILEPEFASNFDNTTFSSSPFHVLREAQLQRCPNLEVPIPAYDNTPIISYYDLHDPASLNPTVSSWSPTVPVNLGTTNHGEPYLSVPSGRGHKTVYAREHPYEASMSSLFIDYLILQTDLWQNAANDAEFCAWVEANLVGVPAYNPAGFGGQSLFNMLGTCYPSNARGTPMAIYEQDANVMKRVAFYAMERVLNQLPKAIPLRSEASFKKYCPKKQIAVLRAAAGIPSFLNEYEISSIFIDMNNCVRGLWSQWATAYRTSNVDAPNRANVNVPNLYDNWMYQVVSNVPTFVRSEVQRLILLYNKGQTTAATVDLSWPILLDRVTFTRDSGTENTQTDASVYETGVAVTRADLTAQIFNQIEDINWLNFLPRH
ncbi:hypothetical protein B0H14DRAFT_3091266 [Mycena olivaceomarginata]|nr:hypothetical protein B0H14DRAFT_3091266 [Mycena olivaceomarginata]